ncbi:hypothetical protein [Thermocrinis minervae]|uniref:Uncharacterized protein n=1 Tax=Thermocrinis minervae TaxID=381751 RepID=A0A1M6Q0T9_9AQUI|nr:hypothetical protein [Thermocrinis minervae]SHK13726.1 hypothetical protein SAMN05444391_0028 [Thermocrinis minervae]
MIKINLLGDQRRKEVKTQRFAIKIGEVKDLFKIDKSFYYLAVVLWLIPFFMLAYYIKLKDENSKLLSDISSLNLQKSKLLEAYKKQQEEKKILEESISKLTKEIEEINFGKTVLVGLKEYYKPFNALLYSSVETLPNTAWVSSYKQELDLDSGKISLEMQLKSLDYFVVDSYVKRMSPAVVSSIERSPSKTGYDVYSVNLKLEREVR